MNEKSIKKAMKEYHQEELKEEIKVLAITIAILGGLYVLCKIAASKA
jgi:hypothetical protein